MCLKIVENDAHKDVDIKEGEVGGVCCSSSAAGLGMLPLSVSSVLPPSQSNPPLPSAV